MRHTPPPLLTPLTRRRVLQGALRGMAGLATWQPGWLSPGTVAAPTRATSGQMTWAIRVQIAPSWLDPTEAPGIFTPFMVLYALHDALMKPMPDGPVSPCLATAWHESPDGLTYDFALRQGVTFHNGDPFTAEDVTLSFERYKGTEAPELKRHVKAVEIVAPTTSAFSCTRPGPSS
jgi:peptide/nickel transport system substrate-binding protein